MAAARYLGFSPTHFDGQVKAGTIPKPLELFGLNIWDRAALDALFDGVSRIGCERACRVVELS